MNGTDLFAKTIEQYLTNRAANEPEFAQVFNPESRSIEDCVNYIIAQVQKSGRNGFADEEIYGLAVHFYDESDIEAPAPITCNVIVNHVPKLSDEEKEEIKAQARAQVFNEEKQRLTRAGSKPAPKPAEVVQASLF